MTKQQLLALLREAYNYGWCDGIRHVDSVDSFIEEIERTNRVGDLELPDVNKLKADAVREAAYHVVSVDVGYGVKHKSNRDALCIYADKLEKGEL